MAYDLLSGKSAKRDWSCGSIVLPDKERKELLNKIDDVRYDVRAAKNTIGAGVFALSGALAFLAFAGVYKASKGK